MVGLCSIRRLSRQVAQNARAGPPNVCVLLFTALYSRPAQLGGMLCGMLGSKVGCWEARWGVGQQVGVLVSKLGCWSTSWGVDKPCKGGPWHARGCCRSWMLTVVHAGAHACFMLAAARNSCMMKGTPKRQHSRQRMKGEHSGKKVGGCVGRQGDRQADMKKEGKRKKYGLRGHRQG
eukprot:366157-Chlamydomonas_euryale.AAC.25